MLKKWTERAELRHVAVVAIVLLAAVSLVGIGTLIKRFYRPIEAAPHLIADLSEGWSVCIPVDRDSPCSWRSASMPTIPYADDLPFTHWIRYRRTLKTPDACKNEACSILFGDLAMVAAIEVNGARVGEGGLFPSAHSPNRRYPVRANLSEFLLPDAENENEIEVLIWAIAPSHAGVLSGPVGIVSADTADSYTRSQTIGAIFTPLACAVALSLLGAMGAAFGFAFRTSAKLLSLYCGYCFAHVTFLIGYADISYEIFPMRIAVPIAFITARVMDGTLAGLLVTTSCLSGWPRKCAKLVAMAVGAVAIGSSLPVLLCPWLYEDPIDIARVTQEVIEVVWRLKFVCPCACAALALFDRQLRMRLVHAAMYLLLHATLYFDSAALFRSPHGDYANRFYAVALAAIFAGYIVRTSTEKATREKAQHQHDAMLGKQARQVAHDIRSPLAALSMVNEDLSELSEDKRLLIRSSTERMTDIANLLLLRNQLPSLHSSGNDSVTSVLHMLELLVTEARSRFRGLPRVTIKTHFSHSTYAYFVDADRTGFRRAFSNVLNNAVEAIEGDGTVSVTAARSGDAIRVSVRDDGKGIPEHMLASIGQHGFTHGKAQGSGLGVHQTRDFCAANKGSLEIESTQGMGTLVTMELPSAQPPPWFVSRLFLRPQQHVIVVDDDTAIHHVWNRRLKSYQNEISVVHLYEPVIPHTHLSSDALFLIDYEFIGASKTGIDLISEHGIFSQSILVTSHGEDSDVHMRCLEQGISVILKSSAGFLPIEMGHATKRPDAILIDDDEAIQLAWKSIARIRRKNIEVFSHPQNFVRCAALYPKDTIIYIDFNISPHLRGDAASRQITDMGFTNVFITTADPLVSKEDMPWVLGVVSKSAPNSWESHCDPTGRPENAA